MLSASCSSCCSALISTGIRVSVRAGSCDSTSARTRRTMQPASRTRNVSRFRAPPTSVFPSTGIVCHAARRHFGSSARSSTHSTIDATGAPEGVARGDGLRRLAEAHVVGEEKPPTREESLDPLALVRIERLLEAPQPSAQACDSSRTLDLAREAPAVFLEQSVQRWLGVPVPETAPP